MCKVEGTITLGQREAISNVNGHSSQTTKDYYLRANRIQDVKNSAAAFQKMVSPLEPAGDNMEEDNSSWMTNLFDDDDLIDESSVGYNLLNGRVFNEAAVPSIFTNDEVVSSAYETNLRPQSKVGESHPEKKSNLRRAEWTDAEVEFVGQWCSKTLRDRPEWSDSIISKCNNFIVHDEEIRKLFHPNHIASSARLRYGYDKYRMKHGIPIGQDLSIPRQTFYV
jgi:hypothetical protein